MNTQEKINNLTNEYNLKLEKLKEELEAEKKVDFVVIDGWAYETKTHDFDKCLKDITIPKGKELWTVSDFEKFSLKDWDTLNLKETWFFIKYPFAFNPNNYVARFSAGLDVAGLYCDRSPSSSGASLGVRFKWKVEK